MLDMMLSMADQWLKNLKDADPSEQKHMASIIVSLLDMTTHLLREYPEVREAFGRVHGEFMKYPEAKPLMDMFKEMDGV